MAADRGAGAAHRRDGQGAGAASAGLSGLRVRARIAGARRTSPRACAARSMPRAGRARTTGRPASPCCRSRARRCWTASIRRSATRCRRRCPAQRLDEAEIVRLFAARDADYEHVDHRGRCAAPVGQRRRRALRRQPQHQLHQHLLLPLHVLRLLQGQDARGAARRAVRPGAGRGGAALAARHGTAAPPRCACKAASIPTTPARPISASAARSRRRCRTCTSTPSRRWR